MPLLEARNLVKNFGARRVVDGANFSVEPGEIVGLLGRNGAGKTTSFRMAIGMLDALPESPARVALADLVEFTPSRHR